MSACLFCMMAWFHASERGLPQDTRHYFAQMLKDHIQETGHDTGTEELPLTTKAQDDK